MHSTHNLDDGYLGSGKYLKHSIEKYGRDAFMLEILEFFPDREALAAREKEIVTEEMLKDPFCLNLMCGGKGGGEFRPWVQSKGGATVFRILCQRHRDRLKTDEAYRSRISKGASERNSGDKNPFFGKTHSQEFKDRLSLRMSEVQSGENNSQFGMKWIYNPTLRKSIKVKDPSPFLSNGWFLGRKMNWV